MIVNAQFGDLFEHFELSELGLINSYRFKPTLKSSYKNYEIDMVSVESATQTDANARSVISFNPQDFASTIFDWNPGSNIDDLIFQRNVMLYELQPHLVHTERLFSFYDYFLHTSDESANVEFDPFNSSLFIYYFFFLYLIGYWNSYYSFKFLFFILFIPFLVCLCSFLFLLMPFSGFIPPAFTKLMREDVREDGFMRSSQLLSTKLDPGLQFLLGSDFKLFNTVSSRTSTEQDYGFSSPEYLTYKGSSGFSPYSRYVRDLFMNPSFRAEALVDNFSNNFLNLIIYLKVDDIWRTKLLESFGRNNFIRDYRDVNLPILFSTLVFPENKVEALFVSSTQAAFSDIPKIVYQPKYLIFGSGDKSGLFANLSLSRLSRFYLHSNSKRSALRGSGMEQEIYEITQDSLIINKRSLNLLADPFTNYLTDPFRNLYFIGLTDGPPVLQFQDIFLDMIKLGVDDTFGLDDIFAFSVPLKFLNSRLMNNFWLRTLEMDEAAQLLSLIDRFPSLSLEILDLVKNPFNCGIWSRFLVKFSGSYNFMMFFLLLFSNRFVAVWKPLLLDNFVPESFFLDPISVSAYSKLNPFSNKKIKLRAGSVSITPFLERFSPLSVLTFDSFWVSYFNGFPYNIKSNLFRVLKKVFRNPFLNYKQLVNQNEKRFGTFFWKYSIEQKLVKLLSSHEFKSKVVGVNKAVFGKSLFEFVFESKDIGWSGFFKGLDFKSFNSYSDLYCFNIKFIFVKSVLGSNVNFAYVQALKNLSLLPLYHRIFESNLHWRAILEKPANFESWNNFFDSINLSDLVKFLDIDFSNNIFAKTDYNKYSSSISPSLNFMDSLDERFQRLYFIRSIFRLAFKSARSGFSVWQGLRQFRRYNYTSVKDINGFDFMFDYIYLLFKSDLSFIFRNLYQTKESIISKFNRSGSLAPLNLSDLNNDRFSKFRLSFDFFKQAYSLLKPLIIYGEYTKAGMKTNRDLDLSLSYVRPDLVDDDFCLEDNFWGLDKRWTTTDSFSMNRKLEALENYNEESNVFPLYSSIINSSGLLSRNILAILVKVFIKRYYNLLHNMPLSSTFNIVNNSFLNSFETVFSKFYDIKFLEYLGSSASYSEKESLLVYFRLNNHLKLFDVSIRFELIRILVSEFEISSELLIFYFYTQHINSFELQNFLSDLNLDGFYGLGEEDLDGSLNINTRGTRQLCEFIWVDRDASDFSVLESETEHFQTLLVGDVETSTPDLPLSYINFLGPSERYLDSDFYSRFQNWLNRGSMFEDSSTSRVNAFFPYRKNSIGFERSLGLRLVNRLGAFVSNTFYITYTSSNLLPFFLYFSLFRVRLVVYFEIVYYNYKIFLILSSFLIAGILVCFVSF